MCRGVPASTTATDVAQILRRPPATPPLSISSRAVGHRTMTGIVTSTAEAAMSITGYGVLVGRVRSRCNAT